MKKNILTIIIALICVASISLIGCTMNMPAKGNLAKNLSVSIGQGQGTQSDASFLIDGHMDTTWKGNASGDTPVVAIFSFSEPTAINKIVIEEKGAKVSGYEIQVVEAHMNNTWQTIYRGTYLEDGVMKFDSITIKQLKIKILDSDGEFALAEMGVYYEEKTIAED